LDLFHLFDPSNEKSRFIPSLSLSLVPTEELLNKNQYPIPQKMPFLFLHPRGFPDFGMPYRDG